MLASLVSRLYGFTRDRRGNVMIIVGLAMLPLLGMVGLAVDYSVALTAKAKLDTAADAAAIAGITAAKAYLQAYTGTANVNSAAITAANTAALAQFKANAASLPLHGTLATPTMAFSINGNNITGSVTYSYQNPTMLMKLLGKNNLTVGNTVTSSLAMKVYANIIVLLDVSESMGVGASAADQALMAPALAPYLNNNSCVYACHYDLYTVPGYAQPQTSEQIAHEAGATLRIDVARQALNDALCSLPTDGSVKVAIYTVSNTMINAFPLSSSLNCSNGQTSAVSSIDLTYNWNGAGNSNAYGPYGGGTNMSTALGSLAPLLPVTGNGSSPTSPVGIVMVLTDGVQDSIENSEQRQS